MKPRLLGALAGAALCSIAAQASASVYNYDVSWEVGSETITGSIATTCNSCGLTPSNIQSWSFTSTDGFNIASSDAGAFATMFAWSASPLFATPLQISYDNTAPGNIYFFGTFGQVGFSNTSFPKFGYSDFVTENVINEAPSTTIASISSVPEPSTWAMIILGFAGVGFAAYRRGSNSVRWV